MGLRKSSSKIARLKAGLKTGIAVFLGLATVIGVLYEAGVIPVGVTSVIVTLFVMVGVGLLIAYIKGRQLVLPLIVCDALSREAKYTCRPCSEANLREANEIVRPIFGRDNIDLGVLGQWRLKNPKGFMEIVNDDNLLVGCFVVIGLEPSFMSQFKDGTVSESLILGRHVLSMAETKHLKDIYISGIMVRDSGSYLGAKRAYVLIWCMLKYLKHHYRFTSDRTLFAVALTQESENLLKSLNFKIHSHGINRVDKHDLYAIEYTKDRWENVYMRIGDLSTMCTITY